MALTVSPVIVFNASTGSDTAASGAGPGTAVTGSAAAHTGGVSSTTITFTNSPNLSGVATDGSHVLWLKTASGRQFSRISTVDNVGKTVVVEDSFNIAAVGAVNYAIGGLRATFDNSDSRNLFNADIKAGWTARTQTDQTINTSAISCGVSANYGQRIYVEGDSTSTLRTITQTASSADVFSSGFNTDWAFRNLKLQNSGATHGGTGLHNFNNVWFSRIVFGDPTNKLNIGINCAGHVHGRTVGFQYCQSQQVYAVCSVLYLDDFCILNGSGDGIYVNTSTGTAILKRGIVAGNAGVGVNDPGDGFLAVEFCDIDNNTSDGIQISAGTGHQVLKIENNNITRNGGYGINSTTANQAGDGVAQLQINYNNFGTGATANTSGQVHNLDLGANNLAVDPQYTNTAGLDWSTGTNVRAKAGPLGGSEALGLLTSTYTYQDIGASQHQDTGGGGTTVVETQCPVIIAPYRATAY